MLHVLRVLHIQQNRLWTWLEGEEEEREEEEEEEASADDGDEEEKEEAKEEDEDEPAHGKKQVRGAPKKEHSEDDPKDPVVMENYSSYSAKAARSTVLDVKQEPLTMAGKKKQKSEERSPPKVPPKKSKAEMPKKKKDKDKAPRGNVSFAIFRKGLRSGRGGGGADRVSAMGIEDIAHMETDDCRCCARPLLCLCKVVPRVMRAPRVLCVCF